MGLKRLLRHTQRLALASAVAVPAMLAAAQAAPAGTTHLRGLDRPSSVAVADGKLWIANAGDSSVLVTSQTGQRLQLLSGGKDHFSHPAGITAAHGDVFVLSRHAITELAATNGAVIRVIRGRRYALDTPIAAVCHDGDLWVADSGGDAVTEIATRDGSLVRVIRSAAGRRRLADPVALTVAGSSLWVVSHAGWVSRLSLASGAVVRRVHATADGLASPSGIAFDGTHLWVSDTAPDTVTELTTGGALVRVITNSGGNANYGFDAPTEVVAHGGDVYVLSPASASPMVTKIDKHTGDGLWFECNTNSPDPQFADPSGMTIQGRHIWVVSPGPAIAGNGELANSVAELHLTPTHVLSATNQAL